MNLPRHHVFIIYSQASLPELRLVEALASDLLEAGVTLPGYEEMDWLVRKPGRPRWRGYGSRIDPMRYAAGDPRPFRHEVIEDKVNVEMLREYFEGAQCVVFVAPYGLQPSRGVLDELETLRREGHEPPVVAVAWWDENERIIQDHTRAFHVYRIDRWKEADAARHAANLRGLVLIGTLLMRLHDELAPIGRVIVRRTAARHELLTAAVARTARFTVHPRGDVSKKFEAAPKADTRTASGAPLDDATPEQAGALWRLWNGGTSRYLAHVSRRVSEQGIRDALFILYDALDTVTEQLKSRFPDACVEDAESARGLGESYLRFDLDRAAADAFTRALHLTGTPEERWELLGLRATARMSLDMTSAIADCTRIVDEAPPDGPFWASALNLRLDARMGAGQLDEAIEDATRLLESPALSDEFRFSARYQRGTARIKRKDWSEAIDDLSTVVQDRRAPDATRLSAQLRRGIALLEAGRLVEARNDFEVVRDDPRTAESTRRVVSHHLEEVKRRAGDDRVD